MDSQLPFTDCFIRLFDAIFTYGWRYWSPDPNTRIFCYSVSMGKFIFSHWNSI